MFAGLHGKRFEASLTDRSGPSGVMVDMPALRMSDRDPAEHLGEFAMLPRPEEGMPMIGHEAVGYDANLGLNGGFSENVLERGILRWLFEQLESADTPIQDVIGEVSSNEARPA